MIFALAAFAPWALMYLLAADAESAYMASGLRTAAGVAVADEKAASVRSAGGLRNLGGDGGSLGGPGGGAPGGPGSRAATASPAVEVAPWPAAGPRWAAQRAENGAGAGGGLQDGALPVTAETIGAGSVGAAAGVGATSAFEGAGNSGEPGMGSQPQETPTFIDAESAIANSTGGEPSNGGSPRAGSRVMLA